MPAAAPTKASAKKKIIVDFPADLFEKTDKTAAELETTRAGLIRSAVRLYLNRFQRKKLEEVLAEGYKANAALARQTCEEFSHVDADVE